MFAGQLLALQRKTDMDSQQPAPGRDAIIDDIVARTGIDQAMIDRLIRSFYGRARLDPLIGPIFEERVHDWEAHFDRMGAFWSSVALMSGRYHGQPMTKHMPLPIDTPHFDRWLEIFAATAHDVCSPPAAAHFLERAHRIADSLELGIAFKKGEIRPKRARPASTFPPAQSAEASPCAVALKIARPARVNPPTSGTDR
jgi:hemoglobin